MVRKANLIWNVGPSPSTHVQMPSLGYSTKALCGWDLRKGAVPTVDSEYGAPECKKCLYLLNRLSDADLKEAGVEYVVKPDTDPEAGIENLYLKQGAEQARRLGLEVDG